MARSSNSAGCPEIARSGDQTGDGIVITDVGGIVQYVNPVFARLTGYSSDEVVGKNARILDSGQNSLDLYKDLRTSVQAGETWSGELTLRGKDGSFFTQEIRVAPIHSLNGERIQYLITIHDISGHRAAEEAKALLAAIVESSEDAIFAFAPSGEILTWNRGAENLYGYSPTEIIGQQVEKIVPPDRRAFVDECRVRLSSGERGLRYEGVGLRKDGRLIQIFVTACPVPDSSGKVRAISLHIHDISEQKRIEATLRESEERFRIVADGCPEPLWTTRPGGELFFINRAFREFCGKTFEEIEGSGWQQILHPDDLQAYVDALLRAEGEHAPFSAQARALRADDEWRLMETHAEPRFAADGEFLGYVGVSPDITERKQAEQALFESEEKFRQLAENIRDVFWVIRPEGKQVEYVSPAYEQVWGRSCEILYERPAVWLEFIHPDDINVAKALLASEIKDGPVAAEYRIQTPDGGQKWIRDRGFPIRGKRGELIRIVGIAEDITEQKRYEEELIRTREEANAANRLLSAQHAILDAERRILRTFMDNVPDLMFVKDTNFKFVVANRETARSAGLENPDDMIGKDDFAFLPPEYSARYREDDERVIESGQPLFDREERGGAPGGEVRYLLTTKVPLFGANGEVTGIAGIGRDITARKKNEDMLRETNRQLQKATARANELALEAAAANRAKSRFLANMSHEIRTPMNGIVGMNQLLLGTDLTAEQRQYVGVAQTCGRTLLALIDNILDLSKIEAGKVTLEKSPLEVRQVVTDVILLLGLKAEEKGLRIGSNVSKQVPSQLKGDAHRLGQILTNLAGNAIKFTERGKVEVHVELVREAHGMATLHFAVSDTGIGISNDQMKDLFSPFVQADASTTRKYGGTGLGLTISKQLVEMMGGEIGVDSCAGQGSTFWFTAVFETVSSLERQSKGTKRKTAFDDHFGASGRGHGERILVGEDNPTNQFVVLAQLHKLGYRADAVNNGIEVVQAVKDRKYDLILMDCEMPLMDGYEATQRIRELGYREVPIIALTADVMASVRERCLVAGMNDYLAKPLELPQLREMLAMWVKQKRDGAANEERPGAKGSLQPCRFDAESLFRRLMGDRDLARTILQVFLNNAPSQFESLEKLLLKGNSADVAMQAHALKGAAATVEARIVRQVAQAIEENAKLGHLKQCRELLPKLAEELERFRSELKNNRALDSLE